MRSRVWEMRIFHSRTYNKRTSRQACQILVGEKLLRIMGLTVKLGNDNVWLLHNNLQDTKGIRKRKGIM